MNAQGPSLEDEGIPDLEGPSERLRASGTGDDGVIPPRDRALTMAATTAEGQRQGESLDDRLTAELPDVRGEDLGVWVGEPPDTDHR